MKSKNIWFKLLVIFLSISILIPNFSGYKSIATAAAKETVDKATLSVPPEPAVPSLPTSPDVYDAPEVEYDTSTIQKLPEYDIETYEIDPSLAPAKETLEDRTNQIKAKYSQLKLNLNSKGKVASVLEPIVFTKEQIKSLMEQGASIEDIYELAYLSSEQQIDPFELYQNKATFIGSWDDLRQTLTNDKSSVTDGVYSIDSAKNVLDNVTVIKNVYTVTDSVYLDNTKLLTSAAVSALDFNINSTITDFNMEVINQTAKPQFSDRSASSEIVDPASGTLTWKDTQISLPGRDGLDLNVGVMFNSNQSMFFEPSTGYANYNNTKFDLGTGWGFRFPSVQNDSRGTLYYHDGEGAVYQVQLLADGALDGYTHLIGYKGKNMRFMSDASHTFSNGQYSSDYYLEYADKKREYFGGPGQLLLGIVDRFGNKITFNYANQPTAVGSSYLLSEITDSIGRKISFQYDYINNSPLLTDQEAAEEKIVVIVHNLSGEENQKVTYARKRVGYILQTVYPNGSFYNFWIGTPSPVLTSITNQNGDQIQFKHSKDLYFYNTQMKSFKPWDSNTGAVGYIQLNEVKYNHSLTKYMYNYKQRNYGPLGSIWSGYVTSRYDQTLKSGSFSGKYNTVDYTENGSYDAYPNYYEPDKYPADFTYSTTTTQTDPSATAPTENKLSAIITFNGKGQLLSTEQIAFNKERTVQKNTAFHSLFTQSPTTSESWVYGIGDTDATANKLYSEINYDDWGNVASQTKALTESQRNNGSIKSKYTTTYAYEPTYHFLSSQSGYQNEGDSSPTVESYTYTGQGRLSTITNPKNEVTTYAYELSPDGLGKLYKQTESKMAAGKVVSKNVTTFGAETQYAYPTKQEMYSNIDQSSQQIVTKTMSYDIGTGRLISQKDGNEKVTSYVYDLLGRIKKVTSPTFTNLNGQQYNEVEDYTYTNNIISNDFDATNAGTNTLEVRYVKTLTQLSNGSTMKTYNNAFYNGFGLALIEEQWDEYQAKWTRSQYHYDDYGRALYAVDASGNSTTVGFNNWGTANKVTNAYGSYFTNTNLKQHTATSYFVSVKTGEQLNYVQQNYDQWGQLTSKSTFKDWPKQLEPISESYAYDIVGNLVSYTDPNQNRNDEGVTTKYKYDVLNRLTTVYDALNQSTNYMYDGNSQLTSVTLMDKKGSAPQTLSAKAYNELGLLTTKTDAASQSESLEYNKLGQLLKKTDRNGTVFGYQYDEIGQAVVSTLNKSINNTVQTQESRFTFGDNVGNLGIAHRIIETYTNGTKTATQVLTTDSLNRNRIIDSTVGSRRAYTQVNTDASNRITQFNDYFNNFYTNYQYDKLRLDKVQTDGNSALNSAASANVQYNYFDNGPVQTVTYPPLNDSSILKTEYTYNKALNWVSTVTNTKGGSNLSKYEYGYDKNGNITTVTETLYSGTAQTTSYVYDALNRLTNVTRPAGAGTTTYTYDLRGNRLTLSDTVATNLESVDTSYTYDLLNTLTSVTKGSSTTNFGYYANGLRVQKNTGSNKTEYNYNFNGEVIYEGKSTGQKASYVRGDRVLVKKDVTNASQIKDYYYLYNGHGDVVQIIDTSGKVVNSYAYDVWGNTTSQTEEISNPFKYTGEIYDEETGLYYLRARYYDPSIGRFLNEDTDEGQIDNPLSLNLYTYVSNNPLIYSDPSGHRQEWGTGGIGGTSPKPTWVKAGEGIYATVDMYTGGAISDYVNDYSGKSWTAKQFLDAGGIFIQFIPISAAEATALKVGQTAEKAGVSLIQKAGQWIKVVFKGESKGANLALSTNSKDFLNAALKRQGLDKVPNGLKEKWAENGFDYEVRVHAADSQFSNSGSIYRVARRQQGTLPGSTQGYGWEYLGSDGIWYHTSELKAGNNAAAIATHIPLNP